MGIYRDDLESAHLRIETLEAKLAASEAEATAHEAEAHELRRRVERLERELGKLQTDVPTAVSAPPPAGKRAALAAVLAVSGTLGFAAAYLSHRVTETMSVLAPPLDHVEPRAPTPPPSPPPYLPVRDPRPSALPAPLAPSTDFDRDAARRALAAAARDAGECPSTVTGRGRITVTFASTGRVTSVALGPPFDSSGAASCILGAFRPISVPAFEGGPVTVSKSFFLR